MGLLHWALIFLVVALIAALLGFAGIAAAAAGIARILFVMLSEAKHLGGEWNQRLFSCLAQILRWRSELALSVVEGMTGGTTRTPQNVLARRTPRASILI